MTRRRLAALALAAGCLFTQPGCTGLFGNRDCNPCGGSSSSGHLCGLFGGGGLFGRNNSSSGATPCCATSAPYAGGSSAAFSDGGFGGAPGNCGCGKGDPFQYTGLGGSAGIPQGVPITMGPEMTSPVPIQTIPTQPGPQPTFPPPPSSGPRITPVPQGVAPSAGFSQSSPWQPH
jgi:hypothetical protein